MNKKKKRKGIRIRVRSMMREILTREVAQRLTTHLMIMNDECALSLALMLYDYRMHGRHPDFHGSLVMRRMFRSSCAIMIEGLKVVHSA